MDFCDGRGREKESTNGLERERVGEKEGEREGGSNLWSEEKFRESAV